MRNSLTVVALIAVASCTQQAGSVAQQGVSAAEVATVRATIDSINTQLSDALMKGDSVRAASYYDPNGMAMPHGMPAAVSRAGIQTMFGGMLSAMKATDMKLTISDVVVSGDLAVETGRYRWTLTAPKGKPITEEGKYVVAWRRQADGSWKLYRDIFNMDTAPAPSK